MPPRSSPPSDGLTDSWGRSNRKLAERICAVVFGFDKTDPLAFGCVLVAAILLIMALIIAETKTVQK